MPNDTLGATCSSRRRFLAGSAAGLLVLVGSPAMAVSRSRPRELAFHHTHTGEKLRVEYHDGTRYLDDALREVTRYLRDFRTGEEHPIDPGVLDILYELQCRAVDGCKPYHVISGYRSPATNAKLRRRSKGVAKRSLHMQGKAIDVRMPGVDTRHLYKAALGLRKGGVGLYSRSDFIHLDTGRVRTWSG
jgi:uncharacterized protein YcbK (DUF882 family)